MCSRAQARITAPAECCIAFCLELKRSLAQMTFCGISFTLAVQMKGFDFVLW